MRYREKKEDMQDINISPLIDMVFILLIFFMVSTTFVKDMKLDLDRPAAASATTASTKAIRIHEHGGPEVLRWEDVEVGPPGPGEVRIRHEAVGVNFIDVYHRIGLYPLNLPAAIGMEGAGVIDAVGDGTARDLEDERRDPPDDEGDRDLARADAVVVEDQRPHGVDRPELVDERQRRPEHRAQAPLEIGARRDRRGDPLEVLFAERRGQVEVIVEAVLDGGTDGHLGAGIQLLHCLGHDVGSTVAHDFKRFRGFGGYQSNVSIIFNRGVQINQFVI